MGLTSRECHEKQAMESAGAEDEGGEGRESVRYFYSISIPLHRKQGNDPDRQILTDRDGSEYRQQQAVPSPLILQVCHERWLHDSFPPPNKPILSNTSPFTPPPTRFPQSGILIPYMLALKTGRSA